ncbi:MAG: type II secretion system F family protein [Proteobacteria bacterium]|nr:type II secretion system F family protein [Pseudomonadota bacterium]
MPIYVWEGRTKTGETRKGENEAQNEGLLIQQLRTQQIVPFKVKEKKAGFKLSQLPIIGSMLGGAQGVPLSELVIFTRQFATMIDAGLPLVQCLDILANQNPNKNFKSILLNIKESVEGGSTFAQALERHPQVFDKLFCALIAAGEVGGILDTILNRLGVFMEKSEALKRKVKGAMIYPTIVVVALVAVITVLLVFVVPVFQKMFADMGGTLPAPTRVVVAMSNFMKHYIFHVAATIVALVFAWKYTRKSEKGRAITDDLFLKAPVFGDLIRKQAVARFTRTLGTMISSGVPILEGLEICSRTAGNVTIEKAILFAKTSIAEGKSIAEPLKASSVFPSMVVQMIAVGEQTGALDAMLNKIADFYDIEVDTAVDGLTSMIEPVIMIVLSVVVGGFLISMYLPIFSLANVVG